MPKNEKIKKILVIGSGPEVIGNSGEYSGPGLQMKRALGELGYKTVVVDSNPASLLTDAEMCEATYIEPLNIKRLEQVILKEKPDAVMPGFGGLSGYSLSLSLAKAGILEKNNVKLLGISAEAMELSEDRVALKNALKEKGIFMPESRGARTVSEAEEIAESFSYPVMIRPVLSSGGTPGGIVYNCDELRDVVTKCAAVSLVGRVLVEKTVLGWEELEIEVLRDASGNKLMVCGIESIDKMGIHRGDSINVSPMLTVSDELCEKLKEQAFIAADLISIAGTLNVQFAYNRESGDIFLMKLNARATRSTAFASKATGLAIAEIATKLALGLGFDEIDIDGKMLSEYEIAQKYVCVRLPKWELGNLEGVSEILCTQMKSLGEVIGIGKDFSEAIVNAARAIKFRGFYSFLEKLSKKSLDEHLYMLGEPTSKRQLIIFSALKKGASPEELSQITGINRWYIEKLAEIVSLTQKIIKTDDEIDLDALSALKLCGFSDSYIARRHGIEAEELKNAKKDAEIQAKWYKSGEFVFISAADCDLEEDKVSDSANKVILLSVATNKIGQGDEIEYSCAIAAEELKKAGFYVIMVSSNPSSVSTQREYFDKLYIAPVSTECVEEIYLREKAIGVISQFGGSDSVLLGGELKMRGLNVLGIGEETYGVLSEKDRFNILMESISVPVPKMAMAVSAEEAKAAGEEIGYPLLVRPFYECEEKKSEIIYDSKELAKYMEAPGVITFKKPVILEKFLFAAVEAEVDCAVLNGEVYLPVIAENVEHAGVHSGDSACIIPSVNILLADKNMILDYTKKIAAKLGISGLLNLHFAIAKDGIYVLEANVGASRTVPLAIKACGRDLIKAAVYALASDYTESFKPDFNEEKSETKYYCVKEAVFPFSVFPELDPVLGPEMRSTGEVLGISDSLGIAFFKSQEAAFSFLPTSGRVFISVDDSGKSEAVYVADKFSKLGFEIIATRGTYKKLTENGIPCKLVKKMYEGRPNVYDEILNGKIDIVINTTAGKRSIDDDSFIRKLAVRKDIPNITTMAAAKATVDGIEAYLNKSEVVPVSLQELRNL